MRHRAESDQGRLRSLAPVQADAPNQPRASRLRTISAGFMLAHVPPVWIVVQSGR
jgi:hypothetical protein